jgi:hypothetical protein
VAVVFLLQWRHLDSFVRLQIATFLHISNLACKKGDGRRGEL